MQPLISIIVPCYNCELYLRRALDSVKKQNYSHYEIICIDDASEDNTLKILKECEAKDSRVKIIVSEKNRGAGASRNIGLSEAKGDYIVFLDADDTFVPKTLDRFVKRVLETNADVVISAYRNYGESQILGLKKEYLDGKNIFKASEIEDYVFNFTLGTPWAKCIKRTFLLKNQIMFPEVARSEDFIFAFSCFIKAKSIAIMDDVLYIYYKTPGSLEHTKLKTPFISWEMVKFLKMLLKEQDVFEQYKRAFINFGIHDCGYNIWAMSEQTNNKLVIKEMFDSNGVTQEIIEELELQKHPKDYFYEGDYQNVLDFTTMDFADYAKLTVEQYQKEIIEVKKSLADVKSGMSFRIGRIITWGPRKLFGRQ